VRAGLILAATLLSIVASFRTGLPVAAAWVLAAACGAIGVRALRKRRSHRVTLPADAPASLDGVVGAATAKAITPLFVLLEVVSPDRRSTYALIFCDELDPEGFRQLLVALRNR
jgi:hypothetical protein